MLSGSRVALFLTEEQNRYQKLLHADAARHAEQTGIVLEVSFCSLGVARQVEQLRAAIRRPADERPRAVLVMPAEDASMREVAREVAAAGVGWVLLNRRAAFLDRLPYEFPALPIFTVSPNDHEIGKVQGRQLRAALPRNARVLLARGGSGPTAVDREAGLRSSLTGSQIGVDVLYGSWAFQGASNALDKHFSMAARKTARLDAIACQNDEIALAAVQALERAAGRLARPELTRVKVFGCDGLPDEGQRYVREGKFSATVVVPPTSGAAIQALADAFDRGVQPPAELNVPCTPLPSESDLARAAGRSE
jgi:ABC-type sugar transport system substrate-binding protein